MNPRTTGILFLIAAALGAFVWFYEIAGEAGRKDAETAAKRLFPGIEASAVEQIELTATGGERALLERQAGEWRLAQPVAAPADAFVADAIASGLVQLGSDDRFENPQPLPVYGLEDAGHDLRFRAGGVDRVLRLGRKTPVAGGRFAWVGGQQRVFVVPDSAVTGLAKSLDDLREKRILRFDGDAVERITLRWPGGHVVLARGDAGWRLEEPLAGPADETSIDDLLGNLAFLRASGFVDAPTAAQERALATPELEIELVTKAGEKSESPTRLELAIGARDGAEGDRLVRAGGPGLYRIAPERLEDYPREAASYRFRELSRFEVSQAERMELSFETPGEPALTLTATRKDAAWSSAPESIEPARLDSMIDELSRLRAKQILADAMGEAELRELGLAPARVRITVTGKQGQLAQVDLGRARGSDGIVARATSGPTVYLLAPTIADALPVNLEALRSRFLVETAESAAAPEPAPEPAED